MRGRSTTPHNFPCTVPPQELGSRPRTLWAVHSSPYSPPHQGSDLVPHRILRTRTSHNLLTSETAVSGVTLFLTVGHVEEPHSGVVGAGAGLEGKMADLSWQLRTSSQVSP